MSKTKLRAAELLLMNRTQTLALLDHIDATQGGEPTPLQLEELNILQREGAWHEADLVEADPVAELERIYKLEDPRP